MNMKHRLKGLRQFENSLTKDVFVLAAVAIFVLILGFIVNSQCYNDLMLTEHHFSYCETPLELNKHSFCQLYSTVIHSLASTVALLYVCFPFIKKRSQSLDFMLLTFMINIWTALGHCSSHPTLWLCEPMSFLAEMTRISWLFIGCERPCGNVFKLGIVLSVVPVFVFFAMGLNVQKAFTACYIMLLLLYLMLCFSKSLQKSFVRPELIRLQNHIHGYVIGVTSLVILGEIDNMYCYPETDHPWISHYLHIPFDVVKFVFLDSWLTWTFLESCKTRCRPRRRATASHIAKAVQRTRKECSR